MTCKSTQFIDKAFALSEPKSTTLALSGRLWSQCHVFFVKKSLFALTITKTCVWGEDPQFHICGMYWAASTAWRISFLTFVVPNSSSCRPSTLLPEWSRHSSWTWTSVLTEIFTEVLSSQSCVRFVDQLLDVHHAVYQCSITTWLWICGCDISEFRILLHTSRQLADLFPAGELTCQYIAESSNSILGVKVNMYNGQLYTYNHCFRTLQALSAS